jgi:hypothetical protein
MNQADWLSAFYAGAELLDGHGTGMLEVSTLGTERKRFRPQANLAWRMR